MSSPFTYTPSRYLDGQGVQLDLETAAWYLGCAADTAYAEYNLVGRQPIIEKQRLTEANEPNVAVGELGEDDSAIQFQVSLNTEYYTRKCWVIPFTTPDQISQCRDISVRSGSLHYLRMQKNGAMCYHPHS